MTESQFDDNKLLLNNKSDMIEEIDEVRLWNNLLS